ncbi:MAG: hypothetical protein JXA00_02090 [Candidatus Thermoplasmatota archaeon]|nr:hypothetical protein [Candidatus Thermoplasmatota archaeon]
MIVVSLVCLPLVSSGAFASLPVNRVTAEANTFAQQTETPPVPLNANPEIHIITPAAGYIYLFKLQPMKLPIAGVLGLQHAVVVGRSLTIDTDATDIHHAQFSAIRKLTGFETVRWDYRTMDGFGTAIDLTTGVYDITVHGYDASDTEVCSDAMTIFYLKIGREDYGVWVNTQYDGGETITTELQLGVTEFSSMLNTGETKQFPVSVQSEDDTTIDLRFIRTKIMNNTEKVVEMKCNVATSCDTTKPYEVSVEARFPFVILDGGQPSEQDNPYFSAKVGFGSTPSGQAAGTRVNTSVYVGRENLSDPRVFRLSVKPSDIDTGSMLSLFTTFCTIDGDGNEVFQRTYTIDFEPATELTITSIPREAKISYEFGQSAGVPTAISLRAEGGLFDDIVQSFFIDPLPSYMDFDLTILGDKEFLYECDQSYDVTYALDSVQEGNLVSFQVVGLPARIAASWGLELGELGDLEVSSFADLDMSQDVEQLALFFKGEEQPFISLQDFPRKLRFENAVNLLEGTGNITLIRGLDEVRDITITLQHQDLQVEKSFELKNNLVRLQWQIDVAGGTGFFDIERDSETVMTFTTSITYNTWTFMKTLELRNNHLRLSWDANREQRTGAIILERDAIGGNPSLSFSLAHEGWVLADTLQFNNQYMELYWQLPTQTTTHAELGLLTEGGELFHNTISVVDNGMELFHLGFGLQTTDHFILSWDYVNGVIENFEWSGKILQLSEVDIAANLIGEVFSISANVTIGQSGSLELSVNQPVEMQFVNAETETFKLSGSLSIHQNRHLQVTWDLGDSGYFTIYTFGQPLGDEFDLEAGFDPQQSGNYQYGFRLQGDDFIQITRTIQWYSENGALVRVWVLGDLPLPGDWNLQVMWNSQWYTVPWPY